MDRHMQVLEALKTLNPSAADTLTYAQSCLVFTETMKKQHDCNDCLAKKDCQYAPKLGQVTRINCYGWVGEEKV